MTRFTLKLLCLLALVSYAFGQTLLDSTLTYQKVHRVHFDDDSNIVLVDHSTTTLTTTHFSQHALPADLVSLRSKLEIDKLQKLMNGEIKRYDIVAKTKADSIKLLSWLPTMWSTTDSYHITWNKATEQFSVQISQQHSSEKLQSWPIFFLYIFVCTLAFFIWPTSDKKWIKYGSRLAYYLLFAATIHSMIADSLTWWIISVVLLVATMIVIVRNKKDPLDSDDRMWLTIMNAVFCFLSTVFISQQQAALVTQLQNVNLLYTIYIVISLILSVIIRQIAKWDHRRRNTKKPAKA